MAINPAFHRLQILVGSQALRNLNRTRVILFGVGGIGSWCAEALVRDGIGHLTLVDGDTISTPHTNRQLQASLIGNGKNKAAEMRDRLEVIHNNIDLTVHTAPFDPAHPEQYPLSDYDYVIDAMDDWTCKAALIRHAAASAIPVFSALDATERLDPTRIRTSPLRQCPCTSARKLTESISTSEADNCQVVYSEESATNREDADTLSQGGKAFRSHSPGSEKRTVPGSAVHVTATFGMVLASLVVQTILEASDDAKARKRVLSANHSE